MSEINQICVEFNSSEWDEVMKRVVGRDRQKQSAYFTTLLTLKLQKMGINCNLLRK
jgi:hypothetical protein